MEHLAGETLADAPGEGAAAAGAGARPSATEIADALDGRASAGHHPSRPEARQRDADEGGREAARLRPGEAAGHGEQPAAARLALGADAGRAADGARARSSARCSTWRPEQVEGKPADARTDLWALGAILYEMLTGKRAFEGDERGEPDRQHHERGAGRALDAAAAHAAGVDRLVRRCLAKRPDDRWDSAHDVADELRWLRETSASPRNAGCSARGADAGPRPALRCAVLLVAAVVGAGVMWVLRALPPGTSMVRFSSDVHPAEELNAGGVSAIPSPPRPAGPARRLTWTPDGQALVFVGASRRRRNSSMCGGSTPPRHARWTIPRAPRCRRCRRTASGWPSGRAGRSRRSPLGGRPRGGPSRPGIDEPPVGLALGRPRRPVLRQGRGGIWASPRPRGSARPSRRSGEAGVAHACPRLLPGGRCCSTPCGSAVFVGRRGGRRADARRPARARSC